MNQDSAIPGLLALLALALVLLASILLSSCASTTFYLDGKRLARMEGDMTEVVFTFEKDHITFTAETVDHSSATIAAGKTSAGNIAAAGTAASTLTLLK